MLLPPVVLLEGITSGGRVVAPRVVIERRKAASRIILPVVVEESGITQGSVTAAGRVAIECLIPVAC